MASWTKKLDVDDRYSITLEVEETSTSIANNTSVVSYTLKATKSGGTGYYTTNKTSPVKVTINGSEVVNKKVAYDFTGSTPKTITLASGTTDPIEHEPDGTKTIVCSGYFKDAENSLGKATASGNLKLTDLHKAPEVSLNNIVENVSYITNTIGLSNSTFVKNLSIKTFTISATPYDSASITKIEIKNGNYSVSTTNITNNTATITMNFQTHQLVSSTTEGLTGSYYRFKITATDSMGGVGTTTASYGAMMNNSGTYNQASAVATSIQARRNGQLTGKVNLSASGSYSDRVGTISKYTTLTPSLTINVYEKGSSTLKFTRNITTSDSQFTYSSGSWTLTNLPIGTERGTSDTPPSNWFDPSKAYDIVMITKDDITNSVSTITPLSYTTSVLIGEPTWTEYKDRVDFKKLTIQGVEVTPPIIETGSNIITRDSGATLVSSLFYKCGKVVQLRLSITSSGSTSAGSDCFTGTINSSELYPIDNIIGVGYAGSSAILFNIRNNGTISARVIGATLTNNQNIGMGVTYLVN